MPLPQSWLEVQDALGFGPVGFPRAFEFYRRKGPRGWCVEVWLIFQSGFHLNLSVDRDVWPENRDRARQWAIAFADAHGFTAREVKRKRRSRPADPPQE